MEAATLDRPSRGHDIRARLVAAPWPLILLIVVAAVYLAIYVLYPTYPNYDSYYSLIWGRELLHGQTPSFEVYLAPTEHPAGVLFGAVLSIFGQIADRILVFCAMASLVALAAGLYRLGRVCFTPLVGVLAAGLLLSRFDYSFLAIRAYIDVSYLAVVVWAAALEAERPRRGMPVLILLVLAGLMRPEAWLLIGLYFLWIAWPVSWMQRLRFAAVSAVAPIVWVAMDWSSTGHPLYSLTHTSGLADQLGRSKPISEIPGTMAHYLINLDKPPLLAIGAAGLLVAILLVPRRSIVPGALLVIGLGTFLLVGFGGFSVIDRYLLVASVMVMVFGAVLLGGWTMLQPGRLRTAWTVLAAIGIVGGIVFSLTRVNFTSFENELNFRHYSHDSLVTVLDSKAVAAGRRCGPISTPNHKIVPDSRWILNAKADQVLARADPDVSPLKHPNGPLSHGVAIVTTNRIAALRQSFTTGLDLTLNALAPSGFHRAVTGTYYGAYVRC